MCGICGVAERSGRAADEPLALEMTSRLAHRGPDDRGVAVRGGVALGQTRLSIIDLSEAGHQPMSSPDGQVTLVYNGEVYNFRELRARLESQGAAFRGRSDTEVVLAAYLAWGLDALPLLDGMFALAVWDGRNGELHLARDRFGIKPLYYRAEGGSLAFASEIKAILAGGAPREVDWEGLHEYLWYGNALGENTLFHGIRRVPPGHRLTWGPDGLRVAPFWLLEDVPPVADDVETATAGVRERLEGAVRSHLVSDVPVGVFLSGGIDSSAITAFASRHHGGRLKTFSVGFDFDRGVNELPRARRVAQHFGTDHRELHVAGADIRGVVERLVRCHDEPFGDAANIPLYLLCEQLGGEVKVVLQGDGGDELFAGYRRYEILARERSWRA
ncbi:MAG TPA: asparagine synthase (glutamine-hydrolyzing), partial [Longimicrobiaceae bacterium]|nr:asparagine synthase (glutamine-hydrolyzing) [Longimicrobiaceae bacterium]